MDIGAASVEALTGIDTAGIPTIPVAVSLVLDARLPVRGRPVSYESHRSSGAVAVASVSTTTEPLLGTTVPILTDTVTAMQLLGIDGKRLIELDRDVARSKVPATLRFDRFDDLESVTVDGVAVADAVSNVGPDMAIELQRAVASLFTEVTFRDAVGPVEFVAPRPGEVLPPDARRDQSCSAPAP